MQEEEEEKSNKKWFDKDCYLERKEVKSLLNAINKHITGIGKQNTLPAVRHIIEL